MGGKGVGGIDNGNKERGSNENSSETGQDYAGEGRAAEYRRDDREGWRRGRGIPAAGTRPLRCRRQKDDQGREKARLCHLRTAQRRDAVRGGHLRADRRHPGDDERDGHQRRRDRGSRRRRREGRGRRRGVRGRRAGRSPVQGGHQVRSQGTGRAHRRSGADVSARNGLGGAFVPRGRNRHRQAHRGRPRGDDRRPLRKPDDLPGRHHLARRAQRGKSLPPRHYRSRSHLRRPRRQDRPAGDRPGRPADSGQRGAGPRRAGLCAAEGAFAAVSACRRDPVQER